MCQYKGLYVLWGPRVSSGSAPINMHYNLAQGVQLERLSNHPPWKCLSKWMNALAERDSRSDKHGVAASAGWPQANGKENAGILL